MRGLEQIAWGGDKQTDRQTNRQTNGYRDSMTEATQWADSVKRKKQLSSASFKRKPP